ncbi:MAG: cytidine deaminase [Flavobacteriales bacterium]|nr:cytidine deaminase [Flavobacteriales bacterium]
MEPFSFTISGIAYQLHELPAADRTLLDAAKAMTANAYAPYSQFHVGAALRLANGKVVEGSNQENAAYPSGLCAERVAIFAASSQYPGMTVEAMAIAVSTKKFDVIEPLSPCGSCRQVLMEYRHRQQSPMRIMLSGTGDTVWVFEDVSALLPFAFNADGLKNRDKA